MVKIINIELNKIKTGFFLYSSKYKKITNIEDKAKSKFKFKVLTVKTGYMAYEEVIKIVSNLLFFGETTMNSIIFLKQNMEIIPIIKLAKWRK